MGASLTRIFIHELTHAVTGQPDFVSQTDITPYIDILRGLAGTAAPNTTGAAVDEENKAYSNPGQMRVNYVGQYDPGEATNAFANASPLGLPLISSEHAFRQRTDFAPGRQPGQTFILFFTTQYTVLALVPHYRASTPEPIPQNQTI